MNIVQSKNPIIIKKNRKPHPMKSSHFHHLTFQAAYKSEPRIINPIIPIITT